MSSEKNFYNSSQKSGGDDTSSGLEEFKSQKELGIERCNLIEGSFGKSEEKYSTKNFNEQSNRLRLTESNHNSLDSSKLYENFIDGKEEIVNGRAECTEEKINLPEKNKICEPEFERTMIQHGNNNHKTNKSLGNKLGFEGKFNGSPSAKAVVDTKKLNSQQPDDTIAVNLEKQKDDNTVNHQSISEWYNDLKQRFEKTEPNEGQKLKEMSCRITGATLKKPYQSIEDKDDDTRHYFSRLVKNNRILIDEELPDPDKVKNIRAMFQENSNSNLTRNMYQNLGGSLQNINAKDIDEYIDRPLSAQCNRDDVLNELLNADNKNMETRSSTASMSDAPKDLLNELMNKNSKKQLLAKYEKDSRMTKEFRNKKLLQSKWTDTGSISSGVSSDLSSYDTDVENFSKEETQIEPEDVMISDDDYLEEDKDKHFVENEFMEKIRSFGTTVTYYGGEMINCSVGPILSPTAIAIMNEINEKYGHKGSITRSFAEFYRKYVEINEPYTMKKLSKSRSFGQSDVFQKPNVMNNNEIEMYKNDLETEVGIRKPSGSLSNTLKRNFKKLKNEEFQKDNSKCNRAENVEKTFPQGTGSLAKAENINNVDNFMEDKKVSVEAAKSTPEEQNNCGQQLNSKFETLDRTFIAEQIKTPISEVVVENKNNCKTQEVDTIEETHIEKKSDYYEIAPKEILFGYEKNLLNGKRKSDMEFEEFEVCNSIDEKLEKSENGGILENTKNSENFIKSDSPIHSNNIEIIVTEEPLHLQEPEINEDNITIVQIKSTNQEIKAEPVPPRKWNINLNEIECTNVENGKTISLNEENQENVEKPEEQSLRENGFESEVDKNTVTITNDDYGKNNKKNFRNKHSRWPIETTVVVDIQREAENTPKIITNGKVSSKTKMRLF